MMELRPLYPYIGGKGRMIDQFSVYLQKTETFVEPFFGGGYVFCYMINHRLASHYIINDINPELINIYIDIKQKGVDDIFAEISALERSYFALPVDEREYMFYEELDAYNKFMTSGRLLFLLNTSYGSHWLRAPVTGRLALTSGHNRLSPNRASLISMDLLNQWHDALRGVKILCGDYRDIEIPDHAIVFCDPPYLGVEDVYYRTFTVDDQIACFNWCASLAKNGNISVIQTNNTDGRLFEGLLSGAEDVKYYYYAARHSSAKTSKHVREIVMIWNPLFNDPERFGIYL